MNQLRVAAAALISVGAISFGATPLWAKDLMVIFHQPSPSEIPFFRSLARTDDFTNDDLNRGTISLYKDYWVVASINLCGRGKTFLIIVVPTECGSVGCSVLGFHNRQEFLGIEAVTFNEKYSNLTILDRTHHGCHDILVDAGANPVRDYSNPIEVSTWTGKEYEYNAQESKEFAEKFRHLDGKAR